MDIKRYSIRNVCLVNLHKETLIKQQKKQMDDPEKWLAKSVCRTTKRNKTEVLSFVLLLFREGENDE
jgi:hypothetical protein